MTWARPAVPQTAKPGEDQPASWYLTHTSRHLEGLFQLPQVIQLLTSPATELQKSLI